MAIQGRTAFRIGIVVIALSVLGWKHFHQQPNTVADAGTAARAPTSAPAKPQTWTLGSLTLTPCELGQPNSGLSTAAWCAPFEVAENRDDPSSRKIHLKLAVIRSSAQVASKDMLVMLAGGPGQAATESWPGVSTALQPLTQHRHVLLLDQRGTGGSNPLTCKDEGEGTEGGSEDIDASPERQKQETERCLKQIESKADPRYYTTTIAAQDLEDVRKALGSPTFDLVGVSYGTRMAQQYAMHYPKAVRSLVLDGVVPNELVLGEDFARNLDDALKAQFAQCSAAEACRKRFNDPYQTLYQLRDALRANPHKVSFRDPQNYQSVQRTLSEYSLKVRCTLWWFCGSRKLTLCGLARYASRNW